MENLRISDEELDREGGILDSQALNTTRTQYPWGGSGTLAHPPTRPARDRLVGKPERPIDKRKK